MHFSKYATQTLYQAQTYYEDANQASNVIQREADLNQALSLYSSLERQYHPIRGNGQFYNNMGEIFFQLEQYPWATFYFYQARALMPRNQIVSDNLQDSLAKLNLVSKPADSIFRQIFFFHTYFSLPERLQILSFFTGLLFVVASLFLWKRYRFLKGVIAASFFVWFLFFCSVLYTKYFEPLEGVVVKSSMLYRNANRDAATVMKEPLLEGSKEEILDVVKGGEWLKIRTADDKIGFIPSDSVRLLQ